MTVKPTYEELEKKVKVLEQEASIRQRREKKLRIQKAYLERLFDHAPEAVVLADKNHRIVLTNAQFTGMFGYTPEETRGKTCDDLIAPEDKVEEASQITLKVGSGEAVRTETVRRRKDGTAVVVELMAAPVWIGDRHIGDYASYRDVTERKRAEEELAGNAVLDRALLDLHGMAHSSEDRILDFSMEVIEKATESPFSFLGLMDGSETVMTIHRWSRDAMSHCSIDEKPINYPVCEAGLWADCVRRREPVLINEYDALGPDEKRAPDSHVPITRFLSVPIFDGERIVAVGAVANKGKNYTDFDVKAVTRLTAKMWELLNRKRMEKALQEKEAIFSAFLEHSPVYVFFKDKDIRSIHLSRNYEQMLGIPLDRAIGKTMDELFPAELAGSMIEDDLRVLREGRRVNVVEELDGRIYETIKFPVFRDGVPFVLAGFTMDITDRRKEEREKLLLQEQLRQSQKVEAIGQLAGGVAHDFNNALTVILGNADMMLSDAAKADPLYENIAEIRKAGERAAKLTRQLLAFSRKQILRPEVLNLNEVVLGMEKMLRRVIRENIELETDLAPDLGLVEADPGQIEQVILNLAVNARDAMPMGGKLIIETKDVSFDDSYAKSHAATTPGPYVMLSVSDTGTGMTKEVQERIFEPFFTTKERGKGTGLGLSTVYGIVKQSRGNIWVYSEPGKGAAFKIYLPRVKKAAAVRKEATGEIQIPQGSETVLAVEDDEMVRKVVSGFLGRHGYRVLTAANGEEALRICREHDGPIHLLLTDVVMPGLSGKETAKQARELRPELKVLFMSGYTDNAIVRQGILEEGIAFIQKPFTRHGLAWKVRALLDK